MITWSAHLMPEKNVIKLYRRTDDLTQVRSAEPTNRKALAHKFKNPIGDELFKEAEKVLEESGHTILSGWVRDMNFAIWYIKVIEPIPETI